MPFSRGVSSERALHDQETFLLSLAGALHAHGIPAHTLEADVMEVAATLRVPTAVLCTPTSVQVGFGLRADRVHLIRAEPEAIDLGSLARLMAIVNAVTTGRLSVAGARRRLEHLHDRRGYPRGVTDVMFGLSSASAAVLFGGGVPEVGMSGVAGVVVGELGRAMTRSSGSAALFELVSAFVVSVISYVGAILVGSEPGVVVLSGLVVLVPGLRVTVALTELTAGHVVSGASRLAGAGTVFLMLGMGVALGRRTVEAWMHVPQIAVPGASPLADALSLAVAPLTFVVLFEARERDAGWVWAVGVVAFTVARLGTQWAGPEIGSFAGALVAGFVGNELARRGRMPAAVVRVPGVMLLVPGVLGLRSINAFVARDAIGGIDGLFSVGVLACALAAGLAAADLLRPPSLRARSLARVSPAG